MSPYSDKRITPMTPLQIRLLGLATIGEALLFNLAFARLASGFDYPDILRRPAEEVLARFAEGGPADPELVWAGSLGPADGAGRTGAGAAR